MGRGSCLALCACMYAGSIHGKQAVMPTRSASTRNIHNDCCSKLLLSVQACEPFESACSGPDQTTITRSTRLCWAMSCRQHERRAAAEPTTCMAGWTAESRERRVLSAGDGWFCRGEKHVNTHTYIHIYIHICMYVYVCARADSVRLDPHIATSAT